MVTARSVIGFSNRSRWHHPAHWAGALGKTGDDVRVFQSDWIRAGGALAVAMSAAAGIVGAQTTAEVAPADDAVVYSILHMTERMADRQACPLDLGEARARIEQHHATSGLTLEYSPLADGPDVLLHEFSAEHTAIDTSPTGRCAWTIQISYQGRSLVHHAETEPADLPLGPAGITAETGSLISAPAR